MTFFQNFSAGVERQCSQINYKKIRATNSWHSQKYTTSKAGYHQKESDMYQLGTKQNNCKCSTSAMSNLNGLLSQKVCHYLNQSRTLNNIPMSAAHW